MSAQEARKPPTPNTGNPKKTMTGVNLPKAGENASVNTSIVTPQMRKPRPTKKTTIMSKR